VNGSSRKTLWGRVRRVVRDEIGGVDPRRAGTVLVSTALPQLAFGRARTAALRAFGVRLGPRSLVFGPMRITGPGDVPELLSFGSDVVVTGNLHVDLGAEVRVGNNVYLGHYVTLLTVSHAIAGPWQRCGAPVFAPIKVEDGAWIATRAVILPGVTIGWGAVVAAGAVVTRDVPPHALVAGVPARLVRMLDDEGEIRKAEASEAAISS
jgi:acetyltransferase-like isoleucine patch superfamily enzyme